MKKLCFKPFLIISALQFLTSTGHSQNKKNDILIGLGLSSGYGYPTGLTSTENSGVPTANFSGEYLLSNVFSLGTYAAYTYSFFKYDNPLTGYKDVWKGWDVGIRGAFHIGPLFTKNKKADIYLGAFGGYTQMSLVYDKSNIYRDSLNYSVNALSFGGIVGLRYYITSKFGLYGEAGMSRKFFIGGGVSVRIATKK